MVIRAALGDALGNPIPANGKIRIRIFIFAASPIAVPIRQYGSSQHFIASLQHQAPLVAAIKLYGIKTYFIVDGCWVRCNIFNNVTLMPFNDIMDGRKKVEQSIREHQ